MLMAGITLYGYKRYAKPARIYEQLGPPVIASRRDLLGVDPQRFDATDANLNNDDYRELIERPVTSGAGAGPHCKQRRGRQGTRSVGGG